MSGNNGGTPADRAPTEIRRIQPSRPLPDASFDPFTATDQALDEFRLAPRPDRVLTPRLFDYWAWFFRPMPRFIEPEYAVDLAFRHTLAGDTGEGSGTATGAIGGRWGPSRNWSGAVIAARDGKVFTSVVARWRVPKATKPDGVMAATRATLPGKALQCSTWVGLDGYRLCSVSLPQVGTASKINENDQEEYYLWVQWWVRDKFFGEVKVPNFDVQPGDEIGATMTVTGAGDVRFNVKNATQNTAVIVEWGPGEYTPPGQQSQPLPTAPPPNERDRSKAPVEGRHAVWIVEKPAVMPTAQQQATMKPSDVEHYVMPAFGEGVFTEALAEMRSLDLSPASAEERDLTAARWLRMIEPDTRRTPPRVLFATSPQAPSGAGSAGIDVDYIAAPP